MAKAPPGNQRDPFRQHRRRGRPSLNTLGAPAEAQAEAIRRSEEGEDWASIVAALAEQFRRSERTIYRWLAALAEDRERMQGIASEHPRAAAAWETMVARMKQ